MATKSDFTETEWAAMRKGVTGSGMLVSLKSRRSRLHRLLLGEASAMAKHLAGQQVAASSALRASWPRLAEAASGSPPHPTGARAETMDALRSSIATLETKAPDEVEPYRSLSSASPRRSPSRRAARSLLEEAIYRGDPRGTGQVPA